MPANNSFNSILAEEKKQAFRTYNSKVIYPDNNDPFIALNTQQHLTIMHDSSNKKFKP